MPGEQPFASQSDVLSCFTGAEYAQVSANPTRINTLISQASALIRHRCPGYSSAPAEVLTLVTCRIVCRAIRNRGEGVPGDVTQITQSTGPFSTSMSWNSSVGEVFLTRQDRDDINGFSAAFFGDADTLFGGVVTHGAATHGGGLDRGSQDTPTDSPKPPDTAAGHDPARINEDQEMDHL